MPKDRIKTTMLRFTPVTHSGLVSVGFSVDKLYYAMGDLAIYVEGKKFHYLDPERRKKRLKNMLQVSNLVYGLTEYLR